MYRWEAEEFVEHFDFELARCPVCERRDAQKHKAKGRTGFGHGLVGRWFRRGE